jgi:hypothetical protein
MSDTHMILSKFFPCDVQMCVLMTLVVGGCATAVIPPMRPIDPVTVYLTDYGRHSSLLLPVDHGYEEFAFGDWKFFALGQTGLYNALHALVHSPQATLGRRKIQPGDDAAILAQLGDCKRLMHFQASQPSVEALYNDLDDRFHRGTPQPPLLSNYCKLYCVRDPELYWAFHNCNNVTAAWLKRLGCRIRGPALYSNFRIREE